MGVLHRHQAPVDALAFSGDGKMLATGSRDQTVRWWELIQTEDGLVEGPKDPTVFKGHKGEVTAVAFLPDGKTEASPRRGGTRRVGERGGFWGKEKGTPVGEWVGGTREGVSPLGARP